MIAASLPIDPLGPKEGGAVTVSVIVVLALNTPEVPVIVTLAGPPIVAVLVAVSVSVCVPAAVPAAKLAVTPLGNPDAARATMPVNPPTFVTVTVFVRLAFCATDPLVGDADNVKLGAAVTVTEADADVLL